jgi:hypothetical protein
MIQCSMQIGTKVGFKYTVNGHESYLFGVIRDILPNGKLLVTTDDNAEFELTPNEIQ